jgi:hypothetical protein
MFVSGNKYLLRFFCIAVLAIAGCAQQSSSTFAAKTEAVRLPASAPEVLIEPERTSVKALLPDAKAITIENDFGDVRLRFGGYAHAFEVTAVAQAPDTASFPKLRFDEQSGLVSTYSDVTAVRGQRIDIVVFVPAKSPVKVRTLAGLIEARGLTSDIELLSNSGNLTARSITGAIIAETSAGSVEMSIADGATEKPQRITTSTGQIVLSFGAKANALIKLATSSLFGSEFSLDVSHHDGQEPNKTAVVKLGSAQNLIEVRSKRGEIRLFRRQDFQEVQ